MVSPRSVPRGGIGRLIIVAVSERVVMDLADRVVQAAQGVCDLLHGHIMGQVNRGLQAEADAEETVDHPVQEPSAAARLFCCGSGAGQIG